MKTSRGYEAISNKSCTKIAIKKTYINCIIKLFTKVKDTIETSKDLKYKTFF